DIHDVVAVATVDGDRVQVKTCFGEVSHDLDQAGTADATPDAARRGHVKRIDVDLFDVGQFGNNQSVAGHHNIGIGGQHQPRNGGLCRAACVDGKELSTRAI